MPCLSIYLPACVFPFSSDFKAISSISFSYIISSISREDFFFFFLPVAKSVSKVGGNAERILLAEPERNRVVACTVEVGQELS